jgi:hypothetical protein
LIDAEFDGLSNGAKMVGIGALLAEIWLFIYIFGYLLSRIFSIFWEFWQWLWLWGGSGWVAVIDRCRIRRAFE